MHYSAETGGNEFCACYPWSCCDVLGFSEIDMATGLYVSPVLAERACRRSVHCCFVADGYTHISYMDDGAGVGTACVFHSLSEELVGEICMFGHERKTTYYC